MRAGRKERWVSVQAQLGSGVLETFKHHKGFGALMWPHLICQACQLHQARLENEQDDQQRAQRAQLLWRDKGERENRISCSSWALPVQQPPTRGKKQDLQLLKIVHLVCILHKLVQ